MFVLPTRNDTLKANCYYLTTKHKGSSLWGIFDKLAIFKNYRIAKNDVIDYNILFGQVQDRHGKLMNTYLHIILWI